MIRRILGISMIAALLVSCGNTTEDKTTAEEPAAKAEVTFASLTENPDNYTGKEITVEGKVVHVCMHSGKKMYIVGEDPDIRLFVSAGDDVPKFPTELLGSEIKVTGMLEKIQKGEDMESEHSGEEGEDCETEAAMAKQPVLADMVLNYSAHVEK